MKLYMIPGAGTDERMYAPQYDSISDPIPVVVNTLHSIVLIIFIPMADMFMKFSKEKAVDLKLSFGWQRGVRRVGLFHLR